ncbi:hypothetical protein BFJ66_g13335 [Fusarium oxysporum f. sp. cepae]|nr:hypothetical protein BFJ66_g13335 [Fusarium oxysporum f. sp. cepae]RKK39103.1 hypothetical protein BFJ67_g11567 [Fusarium oxysporum f. sp. cepae]
MLLKTAPMAGIYVGEICTGKKIEPGYMKGTAEAIDWATDECDVEIISMSIAYEEDDDLIQAAPAKAIRRDKLIFAAASNNGGPGGWARPARCEGMNPEAGTR